MEATGKKSLPVNAYDITSLQSVCNMTDFDIGQAIQEWIENYKATHLRMSNNIEMKVMRSVTWLLSNSISHIVSPLVLVCLHITICQALLRLTYWYN
jgi:hypothetical protein